MTQRANPPAPSNGPKAPPRWFFVARATFLRVRSTLAAVRLWEEVLTPIQRQLLGGDLRAAYVTHNGTAGMWMRLTGCSYVRAVIDVARALGLLDERSGRWLLRELGEAVDPEEARKRAIAEGHLVLVESPREAHWECREVEVDWHSRGEPWDLLWQLGRHGKVRRGVDATMFRSSADPNYVSKQKSRLTRLPGFPGSLARLIRHAGRGTYLLDLDAERIRVFECLDSRLDEWLPRVGEGI